MKNNKKIKIHVKNNHWAAGSFPTDAEGEKVFTIKNSHFEKAFEKFPEIKEKVEIFIDWDEDNFNSSMSNSDILLTWNFPTSNLKKVSPNLKWIHCISAGIEHLLPLDWMFEGLVLTNNSGVHSKKAGEYGLMSVLMLHNHIPKIVSNQKNKKFVSLFSTPIAGKTIVVVQGTGSNSEHTFLYKASADHNDSDAQIYLVLAFTDASDITADDFVLVGSDYTTSALSGVTISSTASLAGLSLPSIAPILPVGSAALGESDSSSSSSLLEGGTDFLVELEETGIDIDSLVSTSALDVRSNESELSEIILETEAQSSKDYNEVRSDSSLYFHSTDLLEEEDILISFDSI